MQVIIEFTEAEERKALPLLLRRTSGRILAGRRYVVDESAAAMLRKEGVRFRDISESAAKRKATKP
jgi:hypothetical protein